MNKRALLEPFCQALVLPEGKISKIVAPFANDQTKEQR